MDGEVVARGQNRVLLKGGDITAHAEIETIRKAVVHLNPFEDFKLRTVRSSFGSWFASDRHGQDSGPSDLKSALVIWVGLYPTVMILSLIIT